MVFKINVLNDVKNLQKLTFLSDTQKSATTKNTGGLELPTKYPCNV